MKKIKKVPKGWSDYQAAWIVESDVEDGDSQDEDSEEDDEKFMSCEEDKSDQEDNEQINDTDTVTSEVPVKDDVYDNDFDAFKEHEELKKIAEAREDQQFPDEVDTPQNLPARERFMRYRGLESFRTSAWDPKENLPEDYARIFQFENYDRTRRRVFKELEDSLVNMVCIYLTLLLITEYYY